MFFSSRQKRGPDDFLEWKVRLFFAGAALALVGIAVSSSALVVVAILVLLGGILLRFSPGARDEEGDSEEDDADLDQGTP